MDPVLVRAIVDLGFAGALVVAVWAFATGRIVPKVTVDARAAESDARLAEMRTDRDEWKALARTFGDKMAEQTEAIKLLASKEAS